MTPASAPVPAPRLPVVWRPRTARWVAYGMALVVSVGAVVLAAVLPEQFGMPDRIGVVVFGFAMAAGLHLFGRIRVGADEDGLTVVNALRTHRYEWAEVLGVSLDEGEPWPRLDLADGATLGAMGIQGNERERASRAVAELRALIHARGEAPE